MKHRKGTSYRPQPVEKSFAKWREERSYVAAYDALDDEFIAAEALIDKRAKAARRLEES